MILQNDKLGGEAIVFAVETDIGSLGREIKHVKYNLNCVCVDFDDEIKGAINKAFYENEKHACVKIYDTVQDDLLKQWQTACQCSGSCHLMSGRWPATMGS